MSGQPSLGAAIFDLDGTLIDSMPLHYEAYRRVFERVGLDLGREHFMESAAGVASETIPRLLAGRQVPCSIEQLHQWKVETAAALLHERPPDILPAASLLDLLEGRVPLAIASSGSRQSVMMTLDVLGWAARFEAVVTGDDVERGKPAPDQFLLAAERLGVAPADLSGLRGRRRRDRRCPRRRDEGLRRARAPQRACRAPRDSF